MSRNLLDLIIFVCLVVITVAICVVAIGNTAMDIQLHDTYFVMDKFSIGVLILGPLTCLLFFPLAAIRRFRSVGTNIALLFGLFLIGVICYSIVDLQSDYFRQMKVLNGGETTLEQQGLDSLSDIINWMRGIVVVVAILWIALLYKTIRVWKEGQSARPSL